MGFFERLKDGLQKTRKNFTERIEVLVGMSAEIDDDFLDELEMILLSADVGAKTTEKLIEAVRQAARKKEIKGTEDVVPFLKKYLTQMLTEEGQHNDTRTFLIKSTYVLYINRHKLSSVFTCQY